MKIRIILEPKYRINHTLQTKRFWWSPWKTRYFGMLEDCKKLVENLMETGELNTVVFLGERK